ncbi:TetR/AcrR family transcriptional regulator [Nocardia crassostreae]|uniref:TetR/AcrR family transcriptional regulator n=1 Tax=Nocardia crassostreae TaxID=53428 RepID=UPI000836FADE|nr:TetR/AcrR family transcriptional regulator [Nocardia crassostreae]
MALHVALIELMKERSYTRITVQDIIDRADVGRSTFYAHYRDKDDLLLVSCTEHVREVISSELANYDGPAPLLAPVAILFRLAADHPNIYNPLVGQRANATVLRSVRQMYADLLAEHLGPRLRLEPAELEGTCPGVCSACRKRSSIRTTPWPARRRTACSGSYGHVRAMFSSVAWSATVMGSPYWVAARRYLPA